MIKEKCKQLQDNCIHKDYADIWYERTSGGIVTSKPNVFERYCDFCLLTEVTVNQDFNIIVGKPKHLRDYRKLYIKY